jgi:hypothetical protein
VEADPSTGIVACLRAAASGNLTKQFSQLVMIFFVRSLGVGRETDS